MLHFLKYRNLIKSRARKWARQGIVGLEECDLESIGNEVYLKCFKNYNPEKGSFSNWLYKCLTNTFYTITHTKRPPQHDSIGECFDKCHNQNSESFVIFKQQMESLSSDARYVIASALNNPKAMIDMSLKETGCANICIKRIQRHLVENEGWAIYRCRKSFKEIREALKP